MIIRKKRNRAVVKWQILFPSFQLFSTSFHLLANSYLNNKNKSESKHPVINNNKTRFTNWVLSRSCIRTSLHFNLLLQVSFFFFFLKQIFSVLVSSISYFLWVVFERFRGEFQWVLFFKPRQLCHLWPLVNYGLFLALNFLAFPVSLSWIPVSVWKKLIALLISGHVA